MISQFGKDLKREFSGYNFKKFTKDLMAGITVAAVALPLAIAFGIGSVGPGNEALGAAAGMITAIIAGLLMSFLSGASYQISGPTGAMTAILMGLVAKFGLDGVFIVTFIAGIILIITALTKCGKLVTYIPTPVITGFTSGIAIIIALGQVDNFFGVKAVGDSAITKLMSYFTTPGCFDANWMAAGIAVFTILIMVLWPKKWGAKVPGSLVAIIASVIVCSVFSIKGIEVVGEIPQKLIADKRLTFGAIDWSNISAYITPAISIAALGMIESLLCGAAAGRMKGEKLNADRELLAQGVGNMVIPFFGGVPATAAIARTAVAIKSGCETRLTGIIHAVGLLLSMFVLAGFMAQVPLSALAGVLMVTAWRMNEWENISYMFKKKMKTGITMFLVTMVSTVVFDLTIAIIIGVVGSIIFFVIKIANIDVTMADVDIKALSENGIELNAEHGDTKMVYIAGPIFFGTIEKLSATMETLEEKTIVILSMRAVTLIDTSGAVALLELCEKYKEEGRCVLLCGVQPKVKKTLETAGVVEVVGENSFFWDATAAIKHADKLLLQQKQQ